MRGAPIAAIVPGMSKLAQAMWRQALHDLDHARRSIAGGDFDWAMLAAQQSAEKGLKAVLLLSGLRADASHNLGGLFDALVAAGIAERARRATLGEALSSLTLAFAFARYPNPDIAEAPADLVVREQAEAALRHAEAILSEARRMATELDP
jgi:HEPN domain-containing protein